MVSVSSEDTLKICGPSFGQLLAKNCHNRHKNPIGYPGRYPGGLGLGQFRLG